MFAEIFTEQRYTDNLYPSTIILYESGEILNV